MRWMGAENGLNLLLLLLFGIPIPHTEFRMEMDGDPMLFLLECMTQYRLFSSFIERIVLKQQTME